MANLLVALEAPDIGVIHFQGGTILAAVESSDTAAFYTGSVLAATEVADQGSFDIEQRSIILAAAESPDVPSINVLQGEIVTLAATESKDIASIHFYPEILIQLAATERVDQVSFNILSGGLATLEAVELSDTALVAFSPDTLISLAGVESPDSPSIFIRGVPITYIRKAVVMHLTNYAVSEYKNYNFNSVIHFNGVFLGINENGVYILDGNDDLGQLIQSRIMSGIEDLGKNGAITIPREAWLAYRSDSGMQLDVRVDEDGDLPTMIFEKVAPGITENREKFDRGIKARFFTWDLKNVGGSDFSLESLRILGDVIRRKTR